MKKCDNQRTKQVNGKQSPYQIMRRPHLDGGPNNPIESQLFFQNISPKSIFMVDIFLYWGRREWDAVVEFETLPRAVSNPITAGEPLSTGRGSFSMADI